MSDPPQLFDRALLTRRRQRAAAATDPPDFLLARAADEIAARLGVIRRDFSLALDLGAHHGVLGLAVSVLPSVQRVFYADRAEAWLDRCPMPRLQMDEEVLAFADASLDLVVSGLALHLTNDLPGALVQIRRALKPDGLLLAAALGGETLRELKQSFLAAEAECGRGASPHVAPFADVRAYGALLQRAGFALPVADSEIVQARYASPLALMRELRAMGVANMLHARSRAMTAPGVLRRACEIYFDRFAEDSGRVQATFEIVYLTGWSPHDSQQQPLRPGSARMRLADALGGAGGKERGEG